MPPRHPLAGRDKALYELPRDGIHNLQQVTVSDLSYGERADLQRLVQERLDVLLPDTMVLTDQLADWEDSRGQPRRL